MHESKEKVFLTYSNNYLNFPKYRCLLSFAIEKTWAISVESNESVISL